jgi:hypothetical protein
MHRPTIGILALVLLTAGFLLWVLAEESEDIYLWIGACLRVGAVMATLWFALPQLQRMPPVLVTMVVVFCLIVAIRPRLFLLAFLIALAYGFLRPRLRSA